MDKVQPHVFSLLTNHTSFNYRKHNINKTIFVCIINKRTPKTKLFYMAAAPHNIYSTAQSHACFNHQLTACFNSQIFVSLPNLKRVTCFSASCSIKDSLTTQLITFGLDFLVMQKKRPNQKDNFNFKIYDVSTWPANNYNTHIAQHPRNFKQPDNEIWPVNKI